MSLHTTRSMDVDGLILITFQNHAKMTIPFNGRRIYAPSPCTPPFTIFFDFRLRSLRYEKDFLQVLSKLSQASMVKIFHFSDEWKVVSVAPQRGGCTPPP